MESWKNEKNKRAEAIVRVSSKGQRDNTSHEIQEREIQEYCERHGLKLVKTFKLTESAKKAEDRKQYRQALDYALTEGVRHLLFYMQDREARNLRDLEDNEEHVKNGTLVLHYVRDRKVLDKTTPESDFFNRDIQGAMNKNFSRVLAAKVKDAQVNKASNGWFPGGRLPLGYLHLRPKDENGKEIKRASTTVIVDPDAAIIRLVRREFELKAKGYSLDRIRTTTISEGLVPANLMKHYTRTEIDGRLHNKFYYGSFDWDGVEYKGRHELIVPASILEAVKLSIGRGSRGATHTTEEAIFGGGFLRCANSDCGCQVTFERKEKIVKATGEAKVYRFYRCANTKGVHKGLKGMYASESSIWDQFEPAVEQFDLTPEMAKDIADALNETHKKAIAANRREAQAHRDALNILEQRNNQLFDMYIAKAVGEDEYRRQMKRLHEERLRISTLLEEASVAITDACMKTAKDIFELAT